MTSAVSAVDMGPLRGGVLPPPSAPWPCTCARVRGWGRGLDRQMSAERGAAGRGKRGGVRTHSPQSYHTRIHDIIRPAQPSQTRTLRGGLDGPAMAWSYGGGCMAAAGWHCGCWLALRLLLGVRLCATPRYLLLLERHAGCRPSCLPGGASMDGASLVVVVVRKGGIAVQVIMGER